MTASAASPATDSLRERARRLPWAAPILAHLRATVAAATRRGVRIPAADAISGWAHNFTCSRCAERHPFDLDSPSSFTCPSCGNIDTSVDHREAWTYALNLHHITTAAQACLIARLDGDQPAITYARDVLLGYAKRYRQWPVHGRWAGKGRLQGQCLDEAVWMLPAVEVHDALIALGALDADERTLVERELFAPAIELLRPQITMVHNIHAWMAGAVAAMAERLGDADALAFAEGQIARNLAEGVLADGSWYECSPHYHYYTLEGLFAYAAACRRRGRAPIGEDTIRRMCRAPLAYLRPDGQIALLNDGWPKHRLVDRAAFYEQAEGLFGGLGDVLGEIYGPLGATRGSLEALLHGPDTVATDGLRPPRLAVIDGIAVARRGGLMALVKANPFGGSHDHPDKPALDLHLLDGSLHAGDLGNPGYGNPLHRGWFRRSPCHNTVLLDGQDHALGAGRIVEALERDGLTVIRAENTSAYAGVALRRCVVIGDGWVLDHTVVDCDRSHTATWCFHAAADLTHAGNAETARFLDIPWLERQRRIIPSGDAWEACWTSAIGGRLAARLWRPDGEGIAVGTGRGPSLPATEHVDLLLAQASGARTSFLCCFAIGALPLIERDGGRLRVAGTCIRFAADGAVEISG